MKIAATCFSFLTAISITPSAKASKETITVDQILNSPEIRITTDLFNTLSADVLNKDKEKKSEFLMRIANDQKNRIAWGFDLLSKQSKNPDEAKKTAISKSILFPNSLNEFQKKKHEQEVIKWVEGISFSPPPEKIQIFSKLPSLGKYDFETNSYYPYFFPSHLRFVQDQYERKDAGMEEWPIVMGPGMKLSFSIIRNGHTLREETVFANNRRRPRFQMIIEPEKAESLKNIKEPLFILFEGSMNKVFITGKVNPQWKIPPHDFSYELDAVSLWSWNAGTMSFSRVHQANPDTFLRKFALKPLGKGLQQVAIERK